MKRRSISTTAIAAIIIVIIIVVAGVAGYYYYMNMQAKKSKPQVVKIAVLLPYVVNDYGWDQDMYQAIAQIASVYHINYTVDQNIGYSTSAVESALEYYASI